MWLNESYQAIHDHAVELVRKGQLSEAIAEYRRIVDRLTRISPETLRRQPQALEMLQHVTIELMYTLQRTGAYDDAIELANRVGALLPELGLTLRREAVRLKVFKGDVDGAIADLQGLLQLFPDEPSLYHSYAQALTEKGDFEQARNAAIRSIDLSREREGKAASYGLLGEVYSRWGNLPEMMKAWEMAAALDERAATFLPMAYDQLLNSGRFDEARAHIGRDPKPLRRNFYLGLVAEREGDRPAAERHWRRASRGKPELNGSEIGSWAEAGLRVGRAREVVDFLSALPEDRQSIGSVTLVGIGVTMLGEMERATQLFTAISHDLMVTRGRPQLPPTAWALLDALVTDQAAKDAVRPFFQTSANEAEAETESEKETVSEAAPGAEVSAESGQEV